MPPWNGKRREFSTSDEEIQLFIKRGLEHVANLPALTLREARKVERIIIRLERLEPIQKQRPRCKLGRRPKMRCVNISECAEKG